MRLLLAFQAFFAILRSGRAPQAALPGPQAGGSAEDAKALGTAREALRTLDKRATQLEKELEEARQSRDRAKGELGDERSANKESKQDLKEAVEARDSLRARLDTAQAEAAAFEAKLKQARDDGALGLLAWLQREGRLIDFLQQEIEGHEDEDVGAAARAIHEGCRRVLGDALALKRIRDEGEGSEITIHEGFDPVEVQLSGKVQGDPPFTGTLVHTGWRASKVSIPVSETVDTSVLAPAEVEL